MPKDFEILFFTYVMWSFHLSLLSIITPKNFVDFTHCFDVFCILFDHSRQMRSELPDFNFWINLTHLYNPQSCFINPSSLKFVQNRFCQLVIYVNILIFDFSKQKQLILYKCHQCH